MASRLQQRPLSRAWGPGEGSAERRVMREPSAADVMSRNVLTVGPDMTVRELADFLTENEITGAPVMDDHGRLLGMVSLSDIARGEADEGDLVADRGDPEASVHGWEDEANVEEMGDLHVEGGETPVREIMTPTTYTVAHDTPVSRLAQTMIAGRVHRLLVVRDRHVVGIVTSLDLLKLLTRRAKPRPAARRPRSAAPPGRRKTRSR
jgi:CBS domain-containing protein